MFRGQSVGANLELGLYGARLSRAETSQRYQRMFELFPVLERKRGDLAANLSGGEQQMLAIAQVLVREPRLVLLDEPSLGLAPVIIDQVFGVLTRMRELGTTILLVEQFVDRALDLADYVHVMQNGRIVAHGPVAEIRGTDVISRAYLGAAADNAGTPEPGTKNAGARGVGAG